MGIPNDFSLYPFDISINSDTSSSIIFLAINRLKNPINNIAFDMTSGNKNEKYIHENEKVILPEEQFGIFKPDYVIPFILDITPDQEQIFDSLTKDNVCLEMANFKMDVVE